MRVGVTGHQTLADARGWDWVGVEMRGVLADLAAPLIGVTSLAVGADSLFAEVVLQRGGFVEVVLPFPGYEQKVRARSREKYRHLLEAASRVTVLRRKGTDEESYFEAGRVVVERAGLVIAVWDGGPARGPGGTADVVEYAARRGKEIVHLDPVRQSVTMLRPPSRIR